jgi:cation:H+ antiporter
MVISGLQVAGGLALLLGGGELLLRGAVELARRLGLSPLLIGLTVVAAATSMPELVVALTSALEGAPDIGVGNVVGSNIANVLLILGTAALISPMATRPQYILRDAVAVVGATMVFVFFAVAGRLAWPQGSVLLVLLFAYLGYCYWHDRRHRRGAIDDATAAMALRDDAKSPFSSLLWIAAGVAGLVLGSTLLVDGGTGVARTLGVSEAVIGLTLVAVGTSLPELATALIASTRQHAEIALGNVLGSNLFNILGVMGVTALAVPFPVAGEIRSFDIWVMAVTAMVLLPVMMTGWRIGRGEALAFLFAYALYITVKFQPSFL